jgi:hypothetical protein
LFSFAWTSSDEANAPARRALLLNGGQPGVELPQSPPLRRRDAGPPGAAGIAADLIVRDTLPADFCSIDGTEVGKPLMLRSELENTSWSERQVEPRHQH